MPGIESDRAPAINAGLIASIGNDGANPAPPAITDFMKAFRDGFITVDDLQKRTRDAKTEDSNAALTLDANAFQKRRIADATTLQPGAFRNAGAQQALEARIIAAHGDDLDVKDALTPSNLDTAKRQADLIKRLNDPETRPDALEEVKNQSTEAAYVSAVGALPDAIDTGKPPKPLSYHDWVEKTVPAKILAAGNTTPGYPARALYPNDPAAQARADAEFKVAQDAFLAQHSQEVINDPQTLQDYRDYKTALEQTTEKVQRGTKEYNKALQNELQKHIDEADFRKVKLAAAPKILEDQAKGVIPTHTVVKRVNAQTGADEEVLVQTDPATGKKLGETVLSSSPAKLTESQANTQLFANRLGFNDKVLTSLEQKGFDPTSLGTTLSKFLPNRFKSEEVQEYNAAKDNWISAVLRKESGAAISASEYKQANKEYFPQDGDSPAVVKQKQGLRKYAEEQMHKISGPGGQATTSGVALPPPRSKREVQNGVTFEWNGQQYVPVAQ